MPIVASAKGRRQFPRRRDVRVAVQNVADLVRVFLTHASQRQFCETFGGMSIKCSGERTRLRAFLMNRVFSLNAEQGRCHNRANKLLQERTMKFEDHSAHNHATVWLRKDRSADFPTDRAAVVFA